MFIIFWFLKKEMDSFFHTSLPLSFIYLFIYFGRYSLTHISDLPAKQFCFTERYLGMKKVLADTFFGPPMEGVYSPSVQNTLYLMAKVVLNRLLP